MSSSQRGNGATAPRTAQRPPYAATCSDRCDRAREERFRREAAARVVQLEPGDWRCHECGCTAEEAVARIAREGRRLHVREPLELLKAEGFQIEEIERSKLGIVERLSARRPG